MMIFGAMYILSGIALFIIGAMAFLPLILAGAASVVVGIGYIKGWKIMWYVGMIMSLALIAVAAFMFLSGSLFPFFGFFLMIFAGAGIVCNLMPMIYLLLPNVRSYFGVGA